VDWDELKHFLAVARSGSLVEAARALKSSPPTVARRVAALESELGARLFDRRQNRYTLTDSGEAIRLKAEEAEEAILSVEREALGRDLRARGKVCLATGHDLATALIAPHIAEFHRSFPEISLELVIQMDVVNLTRREADVALRQVRPAHGDLVIRRVGAWKFGLYAAKSYAKAHNLKPGLSDLSDAEIVTWTEEFAHLLGGPWFAKHAPGSAIALASNSRRIHHVACKAGVGVAILPCLLADRDPELVCLLAPDRVASLDLWLITHRDLLRTARVRAVMDFIADSVAKTCG
jgi:DNA-binding transcriptional LysR family regulator